VFGAPQPAQRESGTSVSLPKDLQIMCDRDYWVLLAIVVALLLAVAWLIAVVNPLGPEVSAVRVWA
jgi:type II secretory pathway component PulM